MVASGRFEGPPLQQILVLRVASQIKLFSNKIPRHTAKAGFAKKCSWVIFRLRGRTYTPDERIPQRRGSVFFGVTQAEPISANLIKASARNLFRPSGTA